MYSMFWIYSTYAWPYLHLQTEPCVIISLGSYWLVLRGSPIESNGKLTAPTANRGYSHVITHGAIACNSLYPGPIMHRWLLLKRSIGFPPQLIQQTLSQSQVFFFHSSQCSIRPPDHYGTESLLLLCPSTLELPVTWHLQHWFPTHLQIKSQNTSF